MYCIVQYCDLDLVSARIVFVCMYSTVRYSTSCQAVAKVKTHITITLTGVFIDEGTVCMYSSSFQARRLSHSSSPTVRLPAKPSSPSGQFYEILERDRDDDDGVLKSYPLFPLY